MIFVGLAGSIGALQADVIYTNFGTGDTYAAGAGLIVTNDGLAWSSVAVAFTPAANYTLTSIEFAASDLIPDGPNSVTISIYDDNAGQPSLRPLESFTSGPLGQFGTLVPVMTVTSLLQPLLLADTQYWVGMNASAGDLVVWNQNITLAEGFSRTDGSGDLSTSGTDQGVVEIDGVLAPGTFEPDLSLGEESISVIPEPGSCWMLAGGIAMIAGLFRLKAAGSLTGRRESPLLQLPETTIL
jgi:hypothetical protein